MASHRGRVDAVMLGVAAIQLALGVPRETVVEDYLLTNVAMDFERFIVPRLRPSYGELDVAHETTSTRQGAVKAAQ
jgi:hypothetical protein